MSITAVPISMRLVFAPTAASSGNVKINLKSAQWTVFRSAERFRVLAAGRRFGKTYLALAELWRAAWGPNRLGWYVGPTYRQAKRIAWKPLKEMTREYRASKPNETDLSVELIGGGTIARPIGLRSEKFVNKLHAAHQLNTIKVLFT